MSYSGSTGVVSRIFDAALSPESWPLALQAVAKTVGGIGAAYIVRSKETAGVEWIRLSEPSAALEANYVSHYAAIDGYSPLIDASAQGSWLKLSKCFSKSCLRTDEWYNDFVVKAGVDDILGVRLADHPARTAILGIHYDTRRACAVARGAQLKELFEVLSRATRLQYELEGLRWKSSLGLHALDRLAAGVIVTDGRRRLIEMNRAAETILRRDDALSVREHRLCAGRADEDTKLAQLITAAVAREIGSLGAGRTLIGRGAGRMGYTLTVAPLRGDLTIDGRPLAMVIVTDPDAQSVSASDLADCFGLSPAESRLALALMTGKKLADIALVFGVRITTLRTQLSSILRKAGVKRQIDLLRVLPTVTRLQ
jgi:DNA-binding CsgD family transcriptional regulator/PAS domain-containing protein